jgi:hypothetical protein
VLVKPAATEAGARGRAAQRSGARLTQSRHKHSCGSREGLAAGIGCWQRAKCADCRQAGRQAEREGWQAGWLAGSHVVPAFVKHRACRAVASSVEGWVTPVFLILWGAEATEASACIACTTGAARGRRRLRPPSPARCQQPPAAASPFGSFIHPWGGCTWNRGRSGSSSCCSREGCKGQGHQCWQSAGRAVQGCGRQGAAGGSGRRGLPATNPRPTPPQLSAAPAARQGGSIQGSCTRLGMQWSLGPAGPPSSTHAYLLLRG